MLTAAASHPHPADQACQAAEDAQYYRAALHELIDMGMDLARVVHKQGTGSAGNAAEAPAHEAAAAFDLISRVIRRTVALARRVAEPLPVRAVAGPDQHRAAARRRVIREVEDVIQREAEGAEAESPHAELFERLDSPDLDDEIGDRPVADVIADICRDLGLAAMPGTHPWKRRTPHDVAELCARAAQLRAAPEPVITGSVPPPVVTHPASDGTETGVDPPRPRDGGAGLLPFRPPRGG